MKTQIKRYILLVLFAISQLQVNAIVAQGKQNASVVVCDSVQISVLTDRLDEIKDMDKSKLTRKEKKVLRQEVMGLKEKLNIVPTGIYISSGALIIIVILLIILL